MHRGGHSACFMATPITIWVCVFIHITKLLLYFITSAIKEFNELLESILEMKIPELLLYKFV